MLPLTFSFVGACLNHQCLNNVTPGIPRMQYTGVNLTLMLKNIIQNAHCIAKHFEMPLFETRLALGADSVTNRQVTDRYGYLLY